jgi:hypothetical protein
MKARSARMTSILVVSFAIGVGGAAAIADIVGSPAALDAATRQVTRTVTSSVTATRTTQRSEASVTAIPRASVAPAILKSGYRSAFAALAEQHPHIGLAVTPIGVGQTITLGDDSGQHAWSTMKVGVLAALIHVQGSLSADQRQLASEAITQSDNAAVNALFADLEARTGGLGPASLVIQSLLRRSGDETTTVNTVEPAGGFSTFGQTLWKPSEAVKFYRALVLNCLQIPSTYTNYILGLMGQVIPSESWGLGSAGFQPQIRVFFKGGWGPEPYGYLVRQSGIVVAGATGAVVSMTVDAPDFDTGTVVMTDIARWVREYLNLAPQQRATCGE